MLQRKQPASSAVNKGKVKSKTSKIQKRKPLFTRNSLKKMKTSSLQRHTKPSRSNSLQKIETSSLRGHVESPLQKIKIKTAILTGKTVQHPLASETPPQINPATAGVAMGSQKSPPSLLPPPNKPSHCRSSQRISKITFFSNKTTKRGSLARIEK